jgi:fibronectin type 3 domain-containing protein
MSAVTAFITAVPLDDHPSDALENFFEGVPTMADFLNRFRKAKRSNAANRGTSAAPIWSGLDPLEPRLMCAANPLFNSEPVDVSGSFSPAQTVSIASFASGNRVIMLSSGVTVRASPAGTALGTQTINQLGTIVDGPVTASLGGTLFNWYNVNWDAGVDGWSAEDFIGLATSYLISPNPVSVGEGAGTQSFTVTRSGGLPAETIFASTTQTEGSTNSGDYTSILNQNVAFASNQTQATVTVSITNDTTVENNETFGLIVQRSSSDPVSTFLAKTTFTIVDNDVAPTAYSISPNPATVGEGAGTQSFTVMRSGGLPAETIFASTTQTEGFTNSGDYTSLLNQGVAFAANQTQATITVSITNDTAVENNETFGLIVQRSSNDPISTFLAKTTFAIIDNDVVPTTYSISPNPATVGEGAGTQNFTVTRAGGLPAETVFASTTQTEGFTNSGDYTSILNQNVVFALNQTQATVTVSITNDTAVETNETFGLIVQRNANDPVTTFLSKATFIIQDNDTLATTYAITPNPATVGEGAGTLSFTVTRSGGLPAETIFTSTTQTEGFTNSGDYTSILNQNVAFASNQTQATVTVSITNDTAVETNETFGLIVQRNSNDPVTTFLSKAIFTIQDNDTLATTYAITPNPATVGEGAGTQSFTVTRSGGLPAETIFASTTQTEGFTNSGDYTSILNKGVTFALNQTQATVTVSITNDTTAESNETFGVIVQRNSIDPISTFLAKATFVIQDNDVPTQGFYLSFPLAGKTPFTAQIISIFDHAMTLPYSAGAGVTAYTGEVGSVQDLTEPPAGASQNLFSFDKPDHSSFVINGHYVGTQLTGSTALNYDGHPGYDYVASAGTDVFADADGIAHFPASFPGVSNAAVFHTLAIDHGNGYITYYLHLSSYQSPADQIVIEGQHVLRGDRVGSSGSAGVSGAHLHYEIQYNGVPVDPYGWNGSGQDPYTRGTNIDLWTAPPAALKFDFGTATSPVAAGFMAVTAATKFSAATGFGWQSGTISGADRLTADPLTRDFNFTNNGTFAVNLANGSYNVAIIVGDTGGFAHDNMGIILEGNQVDSITTAKGTTTAKSYVVTVADGQLTLQLKDLGGIDPNAVIESLQVTPVVPPVSLKFDFGTATSLVAAGYTQVTPTSAFSAAAGFGWQSGTIRAADRGTADPLTRDFNFTTLGVFGVNLANGTYSVKLTLGDMGGFAHDNMGVFFENAQFDSVTTLAQQVLLKTYTVVVSDGQLNLKLQDLGGTDPNVVIEAMEILQLA